MDFNVNGSFERGGRPVSQVDAAYYHNDYHPKSSLQVASLDLIQPHASDLSLHAAFLKQLAKQSVPIAFAIGFVFLFFDQMAALHVQEIVTAIKTVSLHQWGLATLATAASFWFVGRYDAIIHRHLGTGTASPDAVRAGIAAIAVSQTTGLGMFTGALARWRLLPNLSLLQATQISAAVALSFLAGLAVVVSITALVLDFPFQAIGLNATWAKPIILLPLLGFISLICASLFQPRLAIRGRAFSWPSVSAILAITALAGADTLAAGSALYLLLPPDLSLSFFQLYPAFLIAFAVALISGTPGGVGPFEVTILAILPHVPAEPLLAAILAYRALYYAGPALLGALALLRGPSVKMHAPKPLMQSFSGGSSWLPSRLETHLHKAPRAEANLLRQADKSMMQAPNAAGCLLTSKRGQVLVALGDPLSANHPANLLAAFKRTAEAQNKVPFLYKIGGRMAVEARDFGFCVTPVSREAWVRPKAFDLAAPTFRQLRRKLRKSQKAGIEIRDLEHRADLHTTLQKMAIVAKEWAELHGGERGFTMGTFDPYYVQTQRCFLAYQNEELVGFATFSMVKTEWVLDLMRHTEHMPDGTMHALVAHAIQCAATENLPRLSFAAVPWTPTKEVSRIARWFWQTLYTASGGAGLAQFKASFAPQWETLYMAAPSRLGLALGAFDVTRAIVTPSKTGTIFPNYRDNAKNSLKQVI